jgi:hypothetical protein
MTFAFPPPSQQIGFYLALARARGQFLQDALGQAVGALDIAVVDKSLAALAPKKAVSALARHGLRGELVFAVPCVLQANPRLLAYYRLLLGYSQKEFFTKATGAAGFKTMESDGRLPPKLDAELGLFCQALNQAAAELVDGIGFERVSQSLLDDLTLLTFGPQLRGGANVRKGGDATLRVFEIIHAIVKRAIKSSSASSIEVHNAARRTVLIEFAADPDIIIRERTAKGGHINKIAIEIKGGTDYSNIHNRLGEAEKSHQKARASGFTQCWTVINVNGLDSALARKESPSTDRFYNLSELNNPDSDEYQDFREQIVSLTGIRS